MCHIGTSPRLLPRFVLRAVLVCLLNSVGNFLRAPVHNAVLAHQVYASVVLLDCFLKHLKLELCVLQARLCFRVGATDGRVVLIANVEYRLFKTGLDLLVNALELIDRVLRRR